MTGMRGATVKIWDTGDSFFHASTELRFYESSQWIFTYWKGV